MLEIRFNAEQKLILFNNIAILLRFPWRPVIQTEWNWKDEVSLSIWPCRGFYVHWVWITFFCYLNTCSCIHNVVSPFVRSCMAAILNVINVYNFIPPARSWWSQVIPSLESDHHGIQCMPNTIGTIVFIRTPPLQITSNIDVVYGKIQYYNTVTPNRLGFNFEIPTMHPLSSHLYFTTIAL